MDKNRILSTTAILLVVLGIAMIYIGGFYAPKVMFGKDKFKAFIKGAAGIHISKYKRTGYIGELSTNDMGFYGGLGAGIIINLSDKLFINGEYEWAWMSNSYYESGFMNSAMGGLGMRF